MFVASVRWDPGLPPVDGDDLLAALRRTHPGHAAGSMTSGAFAAAQTLLQSTPQSHREMIPAVDPTNGNLLVSWVRLDNRAALAGQFGWDRTRAGTATDPDYLLAAYREWGTDCADRLEGDFSFALWDPVRGGLFAARDSTGIRPLYYAMSAGRVTCATTTACLDAVPGVDVSVRSEWLARYIHGVSRDWERTPFAGVRKLPPGHWLWATDTGVHVGRYHRFRDDSEWEDRRDGRWLHAYRSRLEESIRDRIRTDAPIAVENSGGIDSATLVCFIPYLEPMRRETMSTYGFARQALEPRYIAAVDDAAGVRHTRQWSSLGGIDGQPSIGWRALGYPVEHPNAVTHQVVYEAARATGAHTLHSGHGGDEVVTQAAGHAIIELLQRRRYARLLRDLPGPAWQRPARLAKHGARRLRPARSHLVEPMMGRLSGTPLTRDAFVAADIEAITFESAQYNAPFDTVNSFVLGDRWSAATSTRTSDCSVVAASYGIEYVWPLLDRRLMQQYLSTPTIWKFGDGYGRYLHRRAISGVVPDMVAWKASKDMSGPGDHARGVVAAASWPERGHDELHPKVAELIDPVVWRRGPRAEPGALAALPYREAVVLSDWLDARQ